MLLPQGRRCIAGIIVGISIQLLSMIYVATGEELLELSCTPHISENQCKQYEHENIIANCIEGHCQCTDVKTGRRINCQPNDNKVNNIIGGMCPCAQSNSDCNKTENICYCAVNHVPSEDRRRCLPENVPLDGSCELNSQCQLNNPFAICHMVEHKCMCKPDFQSYDGMCVAALETNCKNDTDCASCGASICLPDLQKCACSKRYVQALNGTKCVLGATYESPCTHNAQCQIKLGTGGACHEHTCRCRERYYAAKSQADYENEPVTVCKPQPVFGSYCLSHSDCHQSQSNPHAQPMKCQYGECVCQANFEANNNIDCVPISAGRAPTTNLANLGITAFLLLLVN